MGLRLRRWHPRNRQYYLPAPAFSGVGFCPVMQMPGHTLIVARINHHGALTNNLTRPRANTSILSLASQYSDVCKRHVSQGVLGTEGHPWQHGSTVRCQNTRESTLLQRDQPDRQIEMGMYGAVVFCMARACHNARLPRNRTIQISKVGLRCDRALGAALPRPARSRILFQLAEMDAESTAKRNSRCRQRWPTGTKAQLKVKIETL